MESALAEKFFKGHLRMSFKIVIASEAKQSFSFGHSRAGGVETIFPHVILNGDFSC